MSATGEARRDGRIDRGDATKRALMRAAERLMAERGPGGVTVKEILRSAGQSNSSALSYHFGDLQGLIGAIRAERAQQIKEKRAELFDALLAADPSPSLRAVCAQMIAPTFELAKTDEGFKHAVCAFGHEIALAEGFSGEPTYGSDAAGALRIGALLRERLPDLDDEIFLLRVDGALRYFVASAVHLVRRQGSLDGPLTELYVSNLADAITGMLSAPVSDATARAARSGPERR